MTTHIHTFQAMNTQVEVCLEHDSSPLTASAFQEAQALFVQVEAVCSRFIPESELSCLNAQPAGHIRVVSPLLFEILQAAKQYYKETQGIFHPGILPNLLAAGYRVSFDLLQHRYDCDHCADSQPSLESLVPGRLPLPGMLPYEIIDSTERLVQVATPHAIDLSGIAKGWCADRAAELLASTGCGYVNAGGDLRLFGQKGSMWKIGIEDPFYPERNKAILHLTQGAAATSSTWKRRWRVGQDIRHHLIDPRTGMPSKSSIVSATVMAPSAIQADIFAKTLLILGEEEGSDWIEAHKLQALVILSNKECRRVGVS
ncbi:FAD:protein FMN transferase [Brevibacillus ginsengisoli]|uniref:FAD:protein FMN transferase n=1 Tax=Brevibacillus ginsengisoli TaxID=363854 RepID=UPI003CEACF92